MVTTLRRDGIDCNVVRVDSREQFVRQLQEPSVDVIISDVSVPGFDGIAAQEVWRQRRPSLPFIFLSGTFGEDLAIERLGRRDRLRSEELVGEIAWRRPACTAGDARAGGRDQAQTASDTQFRARSASRRTDGPGCRGSSGAGRERAAILQHSRPQPGGDLHEGPRRTLHARESKLPGRDRRSRQEVIGRTDMS